jgi:hypothetical protein
MNETRETLETFDGTTVDTSTLFGQIYKQYATTGPLIENVTLTVYPDHITLSGVSKEAAVWLIEMYETKACAGTNGEPGELPDDSFDGMVILLGDNI